jgi:hypothetical protein
MEFTIDHIIYSKSQYNDIETTESDFNEDEILSLENISKSLLTIAGRSLINTILNSISVLFMRLLSSFILVINC